MTQKWFQSPAPEGSLRKLGGDGREFEVPAKYIQSVVRILHGEPHIAARAALRFRGELREALQFLLEEKHLTTTQYDLIAQAMPKEIQSVNRNVNEENSPLVKIIIQNTSSSAAAAIQKLLQ